MAAREPGAVGLVAATHPRQGITDGDGLSDYPDDPGCDDAADLSEKSPLLPCDDGLDNEAVPDGFVDFRADGSGDPGCQSPSYRTESPQCQDGFHNDYDGLIDWDGGASAGVLPAQQTDPDPQCLGNPWKNNEWPPAKPCGLGVELAVLLPSLMWFWRRRSHH